MPAPAIAFVSVGGVLKAIAAQRVQHLVLDSLDRGWEIRDQVVGVGIEAHHHGVGQELGDFVIRAVGREDSLVDAGGEVLAKAADGFSRAENGRRMRVSSNFTRARLRFWTLTMRFWTAMYRDYTLAPGADNEVIGSEASLH